MDKPVSKSTAGHTLADEGPLPALVERLTERGIIQPEEAEDMLALLLAFSDDSNHDEANRRDMKASGRRHSSGYGQQPSGHHPASGAHSQPPNRRG